MITTGDVAAALGIPSAAGGDADWLQSVTDATNTYVNRLPHVDPANWSDDTTTGATMLAVRLYHSRSAPLGAAGMDVTGGLVRATTDSNVGRLLRLGGYMMPQTG